MEHPEDGYDRGLAEILIDPFLYAVRLHIENIELETNTVEIKREYVEGLESILVQKDISTAVSIVPELKNCIKLMHVPNIEEDVCVMLGHIAQNVRPVSEELVRERVFRECFVLYEKKPLAASKIIFLLTTLNNTLADFVPLLREAGEDPSVLSRLVLGEVSLNTKSKERLSVLCKAFGIPEH
ncbi:hypothetical protein NEDG_01215 [Nematocida displodere]|uniref:Uncharacterized protein n=1 Tax=Nematocida displodere TaxID=1805483 RepID=A0A177EBG9_9MICR|nr:hypothetical protein NEDG_01215 [Nematocida displodere]